MSTTEICELTEDAVADLLASRARERSDASANGQRRALRWAFPGTVQLWVPDDQGEECLSLATCINLSLHGLGMLCDEPLPIGLQLAVSVHQPEVSFHGRGVIRHCTRTDQGYYAGLQFLFDNA